MSAAGVIAASALTKDAPGAIVPEFLPDQHRDDSRFPGFTNRAYHGPRWSIDVGHR